LKEIQRVAGAPTVEMSQHLLVEKEYICLNQLYPKYGLLYIPSYMESLARDLNFNFEAFARHKLK
jgi:hypothetical protein